MKIHYVIYGFVCMTHRHELNIVDVSIKIKCGEIFLFQGEVTNSATENIFTLNIRHIKDRVNDVIVNGNLCSRAMRKTE